MNPSPTEDCENRHLLKTITILFKLKFSFYQSNGCKVNVNAWKAMFGPYMNVSK